MANKVRTHIRRCHVCGEINEVEGKSVEKCCSCGKHLAPFYFFDESQMDGLNDVSDSKCNDSLKKTEAFYQPIWGLTAYW